MLKFIVKYDAAKSQAQNADLSGNHCPARIIANSLGVNIEQDETIFPDWL